MAGIKECSVRDTIICTKSELLLARTVAESNQKICQPISIGIRSLHICRKPNVWPRMGNLFHKTTFTPVVWEVKGAISVGEDAHEEWVLNRKSVCAAGSAHRG